MLKMIGEIRIQRWKP